MNTESTHYRGVELRIVSYSDGVYNLDIETEDDRESIEINQEVAERLSQMLGESPPGAEPTPPQQWS